MLTPRFCKSNPHLVPPDAVPQVEDRPGLGLKGGELVDLSRLGPKRGWWAPVDGGGAVGVWLRETRLSTAYRRPGMGSLR